MFDDFDTELQVEDRFDDIAEQEMLLISEDEYEEQIGDDYHHSAADYFRHADIQ